MGFFLGGGGGDQFFCVVPIRKIYVRYPSRVKLTILEVATLFVVKKLQQTI